jgi:hypothetical protein
MVVGYSDEDDECGYNETEEVEELEFCDNFGLETG